MLLSSVVCAYVCGTCFLLIPVRVGSGPELTGISFTIASRLAEEQDLAGNQCGLKAPSATSVEPRPVLPFAHALSCVTMARAWATMMTVLVSTWTLAAGLTRAAGAAKSSDSDFTGFTLNVLRSFPHEGRPFTQGLEMSRPGVLIETSGSWPPPTVSYIRELSTQDGRTLRHITDGLGEHDFIEGIVQIGGRWFASMYDSHVAVEYDQDLNFVERHPFGFMGWGLTRRADGRSGFLATDGTAEIRTLDERFNEEKRQAVSCQGMAIAGLNELEMVDDFLGRGPAVLGNVIDSRIVLVLSPTTMRCIGAFHLQGLEAPTIDEPRGAHVANGIAFDNTTGTFYFTGKNWENMYEAEVKEEGQASSLSASPSALDALNQFLESSSMARPMSSLMRDIQEHT